MSAKTVSFMFDWDIVSSGKEIPVLRLLGCALFEDLLRSMYPDFIGTLEWYRWRVLGGESWRRFIQMKKSWSGQIYEFTLSDEVIFIWDCVDS